ncbi:hypothetical protein [Niveibacterium sp.]|uniref:hypothetical protein n=1 Tax=Niveibacterium sp. TaxID=2017444 RepID=UPI0035ADEA55
MPTTHAARTLEIAALIESIWGPAFGRTECATEFNYHHVSRFGLHLRLRGHGFRYADELPCAGQICYIETGLDEHALHAVSIVMDVASMTRTARRPQDGLSLAEVLMVHGVFHGDRGSYAANAAPCADRPPSSPLGLAELAAIEATLGFSGVHSQHPGAQQPQATAGKPDKAIANSASS